MALTICSVFLLLTIFYHHIDKYFAGALCYALTILIPLTFIAALVLMVKGIIQIFQYRKNLRMKLFLPVIICATTLFYTLLSPYRIDSEKLEGKVILRACYEGTMRFAVIKFRENKKFDLCWEGILFSTKWYYGTYYQKADTFFLHYQNKVPSELGEKILNNGKYLISLDSSGAAWFSIESCKILKGIN